MSAFRIPYWVHKNPMSSRPYKVQDNMHKNILHVPITGPVKNTSPWRSADFLNLEKISHKIYVLGSFSLKNGTFDNRVSKLS